MNGRKAKQIRKLAIEFENNPDSLWFTARDFEKSLKKRVKDVRLGGVR